MSDFEDMMNDPVAATLQAHHREVSELRAKVAELEGRINAATNLCLLWNGQGEGLEFAQLVREKLTSQQGGEDE